MKNNETYKITTDEGRVVCGKATVNMESVWINGERFLFTDVESIEAIKKYEKKTTAGVASKIGIPR